MAGEQLSGADFDNLDIPGFLRGSGYAGPTIQTSDTAPVRYETLSIDQLDTETLRAAVRPSWPSATRDQLLAWYRNRSIKHVMIRQGDHAL